MTAPRAGLRGADGLVNGPKKRRAVSANLSDRASEAPVVPEMMDRGRILPDVLQDSRRSVK